MARRTEPSRSLASESSIPSIVPWSWYSDEAILHLERARLFTGTWQYVGTVHSLRKAGDRLVSSHGPVPLVVTRDREANLHGLINVCRHRGSLVATQNGCSATLQCPYHAWVYDLDGSLRSAPRTKDDPEFDPSQLGLMKAKVDTWGPFVFVTTATSSGPLSEFLGELPSLVARAGVDVDRLGLHRRFAYAVESNWKIALENYLECYHCPTAHPGFAAVMEVSPERYELSERPGMLSHRAPRRARPLREPYPLEGAVPGGSYHLVLPNLKVNINPGCQNMSIGPLYPDGTERAVGFLDYLFGDDASEEWIAAMLEFDAEVGSQDGELVANVQKGVRSGVLDGGRLLGSESLVAAFQRYVVTATSS